jgi:hypothetical protein
MDEVIDICRNLTSNACLDSLHTFLYLFILTSHRLAPHLICINMRGTDASFLAV